MHLYALSGQRGAALKQYRECVRILGKELGVAPLEETNRLYRAIGEGTAPPLSPPKAPAAPEPTSSPPPVRPSSESPLVGGEREWKKLQEAIRGRGRLVVVVGEAGVGKTRLIEEFVASLAGSGAPVVSARCYAGEANLAYGPFADVLARVAETAALSGRLADIPPPSLAEAARLAPAILELYPELPVAPPLDTSGARGRFFEGITRVLFAALETPEGTPGILFLDDLQWADDASVDMLSYLVRRLAGRGVCVISAWRDEEVPAGHPLRTMVRDAQRSGVATLVTPERLGRSEVVELVRASVGGDEELGERMLEETEGLPYFLAEYLGAVARGEIGTAEGDWSLPGGARDLLEARLAGLSETGRQVLAAAATIGRSFDFDAAREASGRGEEETVEALEEFTSAGLVAETAGEESPVYDFSHEKLRALVYEKTSLARRRLLHRRVASFLAGRARGPEVGREAARISYHYHLAGGEAEAAGYARLAGDHARRLYANRDALSHYEQALALGHPEPAALHEAMGDLRTLLGEYAAALESYEAAAALDADGEGLPAAIEHKLGNVYARQGDWELAAIHYDSALEGHERAEANGANGELARLHADRSLLAHNRGVAGEAERSARAALALAAEASDARALAQAHNVLGVLGGEDAISHLQESLRLAEELEEPDARVAALNNLSLAKAASGEVDEALDLTRTALDLCVASGDRHREAALRSNLADLLHAMGREEESMQQMRRSVEIFAEVGGTAALQPEIWKLVEW
jgi:tetratricopeptide (TPR) repeat protein